MRSLPFSPVRQLKMLLFVAAGLESARCDIDVFGSVFQVPAMTVPLYLMTQISRTTWSAAAASVVPASVIGRASDCHQVSLVLIQLIVHSRFVSDERQRY